MTGAAWLDPERVRSWSHTKLKRERHSALREANRDPWPHRGFDFRLNAPYSIDTESKEALS